MHRERPTRIQGQARLAASVADPCIPSPPAGEGQGEGETNRRRPGLPLRPPSPVHLLSSDTNVISITTRFIAA